MPVNFLLPLFFQRSWSVKSAYIETFNILGSTILPILPCLPICLITPFTLYINIYNSTKMCRKAATHTHTRLTALLLGLPRWAGTRKVKPIWI